MIIYSIIMTIEQKGGWYMLRDLNIVVIGGDARYIEVIKQLSTSVRNIWLVGFERKHFSQANVHHTTLFHVDFSKTDAILLPVSGTSEDGKVELAPYAEEELFIFDEHIAQTPTHCTIYTGISNFYLDVITQKHERTLIRLFARDDLAIMNSIPTAEGALQIAMEQTDRTIHGARVYVLGFGRVGMTVARLFQNVGARVSVSARKPSHRARIMELGLHPVTLEDIKKEVANTDICINTIPQQIITADILSSFHPSSLIIDLASQPGGVDFTYAAKKGIQTIHALGLPGKVAPHSAGQFIVDTLIPLLKEHLPHNHPKIYDEA